MAADPRSRSDALEDSQELQDRVSKRGFDWDTIHGVLAKVQEELDEVRAAVDSSDYAHARKELGDLLFASVNLARFLHTGASEQMRDANDRFQRRFLLLDAELNRQGRRMEDCTLDELDVIWEQVKTYAPKHSEEGLT